MSRSGTGLLDPVLWGWSRFSKRKADPSSFGAKVAPSLNGADPSFMNSVTGSVCRAKCSKILKDTNQLYTTIGCSCFC
jgi:hypothetical protein